MSDNSKRFCIPFEVLSQAIDKIGALAKHAPFPGAPFDESYYLVIQVGYGEPHTSNAYYVYIVDDIKALVGPISPRGRVLGPDEREG